MKMSRSLKTILQEKAKMQEKDKTTTGTLKCREERRLAEM